MDSVVGIGIGWIFIGIVFFVLFFRFIYGCILIKPALTVAVFLVIFYCFFSFFFSPFQAHSCDPPSVRKRTGGWNCGKNIKQSPELPSVDFHSFIIFTSPMKSFSITVSFIWSW